MLFDVDSTRHVNVKRRLIVKEYHNSSIYKSLDIIKRPPLYIYIVKGDNLQSNV
jgi:hypothetical protein